MSNEGKLMHLEHPEDRIMGGGTAGFHKSFYALDAAHGALTGKPQAHTHISTKYDGSPSLVFGHHPKSGKFFVATKSAFNKTPKLNYTHADIAKNHAASPGLQSKLHTALKHLPKVAPKSGVYQGDLMYTHHDIGVNPDEKQHHFKPNTITYSAHKGSEEGKKISKAKVGMVVHTQYHGKDVESMKAHFNPDMSKFGSHPHVHLIDPKANTEHAHYTPEAQHHFLSNMKSAHEHHAKITPEGHAAIATHKEHLSTYINKSVREGSKPSVEGFKKHVGETHTARAAQFKTEARKSEELSRGRSAVQHIHLHAKHFEHAFAAHHHMGAAKDTLVHALGSHTTYGHSIGGKPTSPEGFVVSHHGHPTKLVHRAEFSRANFATFAKVKK